MGDSRTKRGVSRGGEWLFFAAAIVCSVLTILSVDALRRAWLLDRHGREVVAQVTQTMDVGTHGKSHIVRYRFRLAGDDTVYTHSHFLGLMEGWAYVAEDVARNARAGRTLRVSYWPGDPFVNRPVEYVPADGKAFAAITIVFWGGFAALCWLMTYVWLTTARDRRRRATGGQIAVTEESRAGVGAVDHNGADGPARGERSREHERRRR